MKKYRVSESDGSVVEVLAQRDSVSGDDLTLFVGESISYFARSFNSFHVVEGEGGGEVRPEPAKALVAVGECIRSAPVSPLVEAIESTVRCLEDLSRHSVEMGIPPVKVLFPVAFERLNEHLTDLLKEQRNQLCAPRVMGATSDRRFE